ncbi:MAG TPA: dihydroneopterin aldolase [Candidatus Cybelea sp.]|jgi:dihydroneopterin aldolase|nr:dihydroneopterin aldolase [Candidatus Cybelea sp.]
MDRITLRGVRALGRHGWLPGERDRAQPFELELSVEVDLRAAEARDDLQETVDYAALHRRITGVVERASFALLERLAGEILDAVFEDRRIARASLTISKPSILEGATPSVTLDRSNPRYDRP